MTALGDRVAWAKVSEPCLGDSFQEQKPTYASGFARESRRISSPDFVACDSPTDRGKN
jgi:hypothetical protein